MTMLLMCLIAVTGYLKFTIQATPVFTFSSEIELEVEEVVEQSGKVIVIDPGHGGYDPGKVGISGYYEKDINLQVSHKLKSCLERSGHGVVLTREIDEDLDGIPDKFHKGADMRARKDIIVQSKPDVVVSVHQNAFSDAKIKGAQVFYYNDKSPSKLLAQYVQDSVRDEVDPSNTRQIKNSDSYFLLKCTNIPSIIIECGFLTNPEEERMLRSDEYQDKVANAICKGINEFLQNSPS